MSAQQLRLFAHGKPLLERFGKEFFKTIPPRPGVYLMFGRSERILYIGQTGNLRSRLGSYKNCHPDHTPRKVQRMVHQVDRIEWQLCEDVTEARLRENELLRLHRPKFNRLNTFPRRHAFVGVQHNEARLHLWLTNEPSAGEPLFGAFKGNTRAAFGALVMLLWSHLHAPQSHHEFPVGILSGRPPRLFRVPLRQAQRTLDPSALTAFLEGTSDRLIEELVIPDAPALHRSLHEAALLTLADFYESGPQRTRRLREHCQAHAPLVMQDRLDDLIVLSRAT